MDIIIALILVGLVLTAVVVYASRYPEVDITDDLRDAEIHAQRRV